MALGAATETKIATPATHRMIARMTLRLRWMWLIRAFRIAVTTSAIAPIGCTTMSAAKRRLVSCSTIARPSESVPNSQDRVRTSRISSERPSSVPADALRASTCFTPRDWNCAPNDRNTAPTSAIGMPTACAVLST